MKKITKFEILQSIGAVYEKAEDSKLDEAFFYAVDKELTLLSDYFNLSKRQTLLVAIIFALHHEIDSVSLKDLMNHFDCNPLKIFEYSDDFEQLCEKGILKKGRFNNFTKITGNRDQFSVHEDISEAILKSLPMPTIIQDEMDDIVSLLGRLYEAGKECADEDMSVKHLVEYTAEMLSANTHFPLIKKINSFDFDEEDSYIYLSLIWKTLSGHSAVDLERTLSIYNSRIRRQRKMQQFLSAESILVKNELVEIAKGGLFNDVEIKLTDYSLSIVEECGVQISLPKNKREDIIIPDEITYRELIFDPSAMSQLSTLENMLKEAAFKETQERLASKGLPKGIAVLLHGAPGTGKTEVVRQLAKQTGREIMKVDISNSKSAWFGESEKIVKRIFTDYKAYAEESELSPILLFNEADAIISTRKEMAHSSIGRTENTMQNIILEELENFEGILMATTNLVKHMDAAFERRFLFKVQFQKPSAAIRMRIWNAKLRQLNTDESRLLAAQFDFSGGQIDNIVRKKEIHEIISGRPASFENIILFCNEESMIATRVPIGFVNN